MAPRGPSNGPWCKEERSGPPLIADPQQILSASARAPGLAAQNNKRTSRRPRGHPSALLVLPLSRSISTGQVRQTGRSMALPPSSNALALWRLKHKHKQYHLVSVTLLSRCLSPLQLHPAATRVLQALLERPRAASTNQSNSRKRLSKWALALVAVWPPVDHRAWTVGRGLKGCSSWPFVVQVS